MYISTEIFPGMTTSLHIATFLDKKFAVSQEDAQKLYPVLSEAVINSTPVIISFEGLESCSSLFLRNLLGELYLSFGPRVDEIIKYAGIESEDDILPQQLERLRKRALNPAVYQPIFEQAIGEA